MIASFPEEVVKSVGVYHLPTTGGTKQDYPGSPDTTIEAAILPLDRHAHTLEGGSYVEPHELYADGSADIRIGDKVVIDSATYYVKHVFTGNFGVLPHKRASLSKAR